MATKQSSCDNMTRHCYDSDEAGCTCESMVRDARKLSGTWLASNMAWATAAPPLCGMCQNTMCPEFVRHSDALSGARRAQTRVVSLLELLGEILEPDLGVVRLEVPGVFLALASRPHWGRKGQRQQSQEESQTAHVRGGGWQKTFHHADAHGAAAAPSHSPDPTQGG